MGKRKTAKTFPIFIQTSKTLKDLLAAQQTTLEHVFAVYSDPQLRSWKTLE